MNSTTGFWATVLAMKSFTLVTDSDMKARLREGRGISWLRAREAGAPGQARRVRSACLGRRLGAEPGHFDLGGDRRRQVLVGHRREPLEVADPAGRDLHARER